MSASDSNNSICPTLESVPSDATPSHTLSSIVPRLLPGHLIARHVSCLGSMQDLLHCGWCGHAFQVGDEILFDTYRQDGEADIPLRMGEHCISAPKTVVALFHNNKLCLTKACKRAQDDLITRVRLSVPTPLIWTKQELDAFILNHHMWAVQWISWHVQFASDLASIDLTLVSRHPTLTRGICPPFVFEQSKLSELHFDPSTGIVAPFRTFNQPFLESMFTRIYTCEFTYTGGLNPILQLKQNFPRAAELSAQVSAFAHAIFSTDFSSADSSTMRLRVIVKVKPSAAAFNALFACYQQMQEKEISWGLLISHVDYVMRYTPHTLPRTPLSSLLDDVRNQLDRSLSQIQHCLQQVDSRWRIQSHKFQPLSRPLQFATKEGDLCLVILSNVYSISQAPNQVHYFFKENATAKEQPLFAYEGAMRTPLPICFTNLNNFKDAMYAADLKEVNLPSLTVLHSTQSGDNCSNNGSSSSSNSSGNKDKHD